MNLLSFFQIIIKQAEDITRTESPQKLWEPPDRYTKSVYLIGHVNALIHEYKRLPQSRTKSVVRSSWKSAVEYGKALGLFEQFKGDLPLREELKIFLGD